ncbi:unnamed protein product [Lathyrus oleraceus]
MSCNSEEFLVKSEAAHLNKEKTKYPHRLFRGGYKKFEKTMIAKKIQQLGDEDSMSRDRNPSSPSRHDKWKRARKRSNGDYTSNASRLVAEKIDSLVMSACEGSFVPNYSTIY